MSTVDVMICCYDELSFTIDEIVIDVNSISVSRRSQNSMKIKAQKGKHSTKANEDQSSEGRAHCTVYQLAEEANNMKQFMIIVDHDRINNVPMIKSQEG
jgi:hypothetical protein